MMSYDYAASPPASSTRTSQRNSSITDRPFSLPPTHVRRSSSASTSNLTPLRPSPTSTMNAIPEHRVGRAPSITSTHSLPSPRVLRTPRSPPVASPATNLYSHPRQPSSSSLLGLHLPPADYQSSSVQPFPSSRASPYRTSGSPLRPGSAIPNYFNLDFSFLDDEPPPAPSSRSSISSRRTVSDTAPLRLHRPASIESRSSRVQSSLGASIRSMRSSVPDDEAALEDVLFGGSRSAFSSNPPSPASSTFPASVFSSSSLPFPSRPPSSRRHTSSSSIASSFRDEPPSLSRPSSISSRRAPIFSHRPSSSSSKYREDASRAPFSSSSPRDDERRRVSGSSTLSRTSSAASIIFRGSRAFTSSTDLDSPTDSNFSTSQIGEEGLSNELRQERAEVAEKRKRLALFLDETAAAMEGGKSLAMVLPAGEASAAAVEGGMSLSDMAEAAASPVISIANSPHATPRLTSSHTATPSSDTSSHASSSPVLSLSSRKRFQYAAPRQPTEPLVGLYPTPSSPSGTSRPADFSSAEASPVLAPSRTADPHRTSIYFTPTMSGQSSSSDSELEEEFDLGIDFGLGFDVEVQPHHLASLYRSERVPQSPATLRGVSPVPSLVSREAEKRAEVEEAERLAREAESSAREAELAAIEAQTEEIRKTNAKMAEKRRRTIEELVETEASYASDMAVVRDIFLARARGADMASIADHVMSTGLGLGNILGGSPPSPLPFSEAPSKNNRRRPSLPRRISSQPSPALAAAGEPLMSPRDLHVVFANLEEMADLAQAFAGVLDGARGSGNEEDMADRIGEVFVEMIPRIQQVYSTYCARHHRAIMRLQELEPVLRTYLAECKTLSHGRTNAWDLASLLIKPVQRCLKYPLLLDQILAVTPKNHPDRSDLKRANTDMLMVAEHINEFKKRHDLVGRIVSRKDFSTSSPSRSRSGTPNSASAFGRSVTKKLLRSSQKAKLAIGVADQAEKDDMFDTLAALVDSSRSAVLRFSNEMRDWSRNTRSALEAQTSMIEGWIEVYAPQMGEARVMGGGHERLCVFLEQVLRPVIDGPWADLDDEIRHSLLVKTEHLLSLFENPRSVIAKRNDKLLDHSRYLAKKLPVDRRGSEEFVVLSAQLNIELPRFLSSVSRYFNIIISHFAAAQATYHEAVHSAWTGFADHWFVQIPAGQYGAIESSFANSHSPVAEMMDTLAAGLGVTPAPPKSPSYNRPTSIPHPTASTPFTTRRTARQHLPSTSGSGDFGTDGSPKQSGTNRSSIASESSTPSLTMSNATSSSTTGSSNGAPTTPPLLSTGFASGSQGFEQDRRSAGFLASPSDYLPHPLPRIPSFERRTVSSPFPTRQASSSSFEGEEEEEEDTFDEEPGPTTRRLTSRRGGKKRESVYYEAEDVPALEAVTGPFLYTAATMASARSNAFRSGYPILSFDVGELVQIELEEADKAEGGCGWLLGRKEDGQRGWCRTEDLHVVSDSWM